MNIIKPSSPMKSEPHENSQLETECLFGETIEILENNLEWCFCKLLTDSYCGWIKRKDLGHMENLTHRIYNKRSFLYTHQNAKSNYIHHLPLGSQLSIQKVRDNWAQVYLPDIHKNRIAYVPSNHIIVSSSKVKDWVQVAEQLLNTPYKWGGRDTIGLDCSALLQLSYQTYGENIPRNTSDQIKIQKKNIPHINQLERGCVVFWKGHVGIMVDKLNCIHANAFHMKTVIEPLHNVIFRNKEKYQIIKMMNFN